ncbi:MAG: hypothetical protein KY475_12585 [Planctomycetes bacterium]|nr:hypothetical protein [Planctomycetota bacterium]
MKHVILSNGEHLAVDLFSKAEEPKLLGRETVTLGDLALARDETWREALRVGKLDERGPQEFAMRVLPGKIAKSGRMEDYLIELSDGDEVYQRRFTIFSLAPVARRRAAALIEAETLPEDGAYHYGLSSIPRSPSENGEGEIKPSGKVIQRSEPLVLEEAPLAEFLAGSELIPCETAEPLEEPQPPMPVFFSPGVWEAARDAARRGGENESGGVLTGRLMRDTASPEIFLKVDACIEAEFADEQKLSVTFSGESWAKIREVLRFRRKRMNRPNERILGAVHGHNFLPSANADGVRMCEACAAAKYCGRTTAAASTDDFQWHASVFGGGQPWAISVIWGYNARGEDDWKLYHVSDATLEARTARRMVSAAPGSA